MAAGSNLVFIAALAFGQCTGQELPRGRVLERVAVNGNPEQTYALYLPSGYSANRLWPVLYCLDPGARGRIPVERFSEAAEKAGLIVAGSNNSRNGPLPPVQEAIRAMVMDTHQRLSIDDSRVYAAGFSGGARVALGWAGAGNIAGVVACGAGFSGSKIPEGIKYRIFASAGVDDFNYDELYRMSLELEARGTPHRFVEFDGGHDWLPPRLAGDALDFMEGRLVPMAAKPSKEQQKQAGKLQWVLSEVESADDSRKNSLLGALRKQAARASDSPERRIARRAIGGITVSRLEAGRDFMARHDYDAARQAYRVAAMASPENGGVWYSLAVAEAASGNTRPALDALEKAIANGFRDSERMEREPLLARVRGESRYQALRRASGPEH